MPQEGVGVARGAQVGHVVAYLASSEGAPTLHCFLKKLSKTVKGVPPPIHILGPIALPGTPPPPQIGPSKVVPGVVDSGGRTSSRFFGVGVLVG